MEQVGGFRNKLLVLGIEYWILGAEYPVLRLSDLGTY